MEHNFGHGQTHLAASLLSLNGLAFLFHTVLHLTDPPYQQIRQKRGTRKGFFQDIVSLTKYFLFESWQSLIDFMLYGSPPPQTANSSYGFEFGIADCLNPDRCSAWRDGMGNREDSKYIVSAVWQAIAV